MLILDLFNLINLNLAQLDLAQLDLAYQKLQEFTLGVPVPDLQVFHQGLLAHFQLDHSPIAQKLDPDSFRGVRAFWNYFVNSGQIWALIIGVVVGYGFRAFTTYG